MVLAAERTDVVAVTLDAVGRDAVPPIAKSPISRCDPFPPVVLNDEGLGIGAGGGVMPTFTAEDTKGGGLLGKARERSAGYGRKRDVPLLEEDPVG